MAVYGLFGVNGLYNYGCEAIVRGTLLLLKRYDPECKVVYFTSRAEEDRKIISDLDIEVIDSARKVGLFTRAFNKVLRMAKVSWQIPRDNFHQIARKCDVIISIGGDMFTLEKANAERGYYYNYLIQFGRYIYKKNIPTIIFGASIGPFGNNTKGKAYYFDYLRCVNRIYCREDISVQYLRDNGIDNVEFFPDPAFFVEDLVEKENRQTVKREYIGINASALSCVESGMTIEQGIKMWGNVLIELHKRTGMKIVLIPHVISPITKSDNDYLFLKRIEENVPTDLRNEITLGVGCDSFMQTKETLRKCRIVACSRMHCAINAICEETPALFLTYSNKAKGMANYVYGSNRWTLPVLKVKEELVEKIIDLLNCENDCRTQIQKKLSDIRSSPLKMDRNKKENG